MPIKTRLTTNGFSAYLEKLARAGKDIDPITDEALLAGGHVLKEGMRERVAKDTHNLEKHIDSSVPQQDGNFHYIEIGLLHGIDPDTARYGAAQEFGSSKMAAHPYIRPTLDSDMGKARSAMRKIFKDRGAI